MRIRRVNAAALAACLAAGCATATEQPRPSASSYADFLIGRLANARDDHDVAADRYFSALRRSPHDTALLGGATLAALDAGELERAREAARMAPRTGAAGYVYIVRAADGLLAERWRQAEAELQQVEGGAAEELVGRMLSVWTRTAQGHVDDVVMDLGPLSSIRPYGGLFAYQQAMALDYVGRQDEALAAYARGAQGGLWLPTGLERHADLLVRRGAREQAIALLGEEANRQSPELTAALARVQGGGSAAIEPLTPALGAASGLHGLSAIFLQEADTPNGLAALSVALILDPGADDSRMAFAQAQSDGGHPDLARATLAGIAPGSVYYPSARRLESWILLDSGQEDAAFGLARENAAAGDARAMRALADMYRSRGRFSEAEPIYSQLVELSPNDWRLHFARGAARERLGRWPEAEADMQRALELSPSQPDVLNYLGYSWVDRGQRLHEGLALIQRAAELRPMSGAIIDSLGWAYYRMGDYPRALDQIERAVELEPADATLNNHLGDVYWRLGRRIEARFQWQRALTLTPDDPAAIQAKLANGLPPRTGASVSRAMNVRVFAPAKINLTLRVGAARADGLHPLQSVVMFADVGDWLEASTAPDLTLAIRGEFTSALPVENDNLVLRAARALAAETGGAVSGARLTLEKNLPVASGIGGGSSDAAATLKALNVLWGLHFADDALMRIAAKVGADVPVCVGARSAWVTGIGERVTAAQAPTFSAVLVNPLQALQTASVFREFDRLQRASALGDEHPPSWRSTPDLLQWIRSIGNDLSDAARHLLPEIAAIEQALHHDARVLYAGLSGSGATMFALVANADAASAVASDIADANRTWWVRPATLGAA